MQSGHRHCRWLSQMKRMFVFPKQFTVRGSQFFLKMCPPFVSLLVSALFRWPCSISIHLSPRSVAAGSALFRWPSSISIHLQHFYSLVSQVCHWWCPPFSADHVACLFICLPGLSAGHVAFLCMCLPVCRCWCPPFSAGHEHFYSFVSQVCPAGVRPFLLALQHFYSFVSEVCHCWCPPFSAGHVPFLCICLPGLLLLVSALFGWPCSMSIHVFSRSVTAGVRPFSTHLSPRCVTAGVSPFPLAMRHFLSFPT